MLYLDRLEQHLADKRDEFLAFSETQKRDSAEYLAVLEQLAGLSSDQVLRQVAEKENIGAIPSPEIDDLDTFSIDFGIGWNNHEEARLWAGQILNDRTTFAADGSQYYSEKDTSLPVGAIQIGWFENPHGADRRYEKDSQLKILSPKDLLDSREGELRPDSRVNEERFNGEIEKIGEFLSKMKGWQERGERMPLAFFDGTLLVSFSLPHSELQKKFIQQLINLVRLSRQVKVPFVGYVDRSLSRDLLNLIDGFGNKETSRTQTLYDASLIHSKSGGGQSVLANWGDRTPFCYSKRKGLEAFTDPGSGNALVGFTYLQTTGDSLPARLDIPGWVYEKGMLNEVIDVARAECVIGIGYPYPLEAADSTAVITSSDRQLILRALQEFAKKNNLNFSVSRKNASKHRRR